MVSAHKTSTNPVLTGIRHIAPYRSGLTHDNLSAFRKLTIGLWAVPSRFFSTKGIESYATLTLLSTIITPGAFHAVRRDS